MGAQKRGGLQRQERKCDAKGRLRLGKLEMELPVESAWLSPWGWMLRRPDPLTNPVLPHPPGLSTNHVHTLAANASHKITPATRPANWGSGWIRREIPRRGIHLITTWSLGPGTLAIWQQLAPS
jgi:hypothetical protein